MKILITGKNGYIAKSLIKALSSNHKITAIGREVKRDHATVINGLKKWDVEIIYDPYMEMVYDKISSILTNSSITVSAGENAMTFQILEERISKLEEKLCFV